MLKNYSKTHFLHKPIDYTNLIPNYYYFYYRNFNLNLNFINQQKLFNNSFHSNFIKDSYL
jgi:hypothetical protein